MRDTEAEKSLFASEERSAVYQEGGGGEGEGGGRGKGRKAIFQMDMSLFFLFCFFYSYFGTDVCQKWLLHRNTFLLDYTLCCLFCGLSQVVGPPGTGKTDVAVQIISNLYHNFPEQRTLLVTHSNQVSSSNYYKLMI